MTQFSPTAPISLRWRPAFGPILTTLNAELRITKRNTRKARFVARAILELVRDSDTPFSARDVILSVLHKDKGQPVSNVVYNTSWHDVVQRVLAVLRSQRPQDVLSL